VTHCVAIALALLLVSPLLALDGDIGMHDPSTVVVHNGKFYSCHTEIGATGGSAFREGVLVEA